MMIQPWLVFKQDSERKPHQMVGSVRAADAETALLQARSVYARRPKAVSMWIVPQETTLQWTQEQAALADAEIEVTEGKPEIWQVFRKTGQRRAMTFVEHVGEVGGISAENAMHNAISTFSDQKETWVWMVVPDAQIVRSDPADNASWFDTALDKTYKQQSAYGFVGLAPKSKTHKANQGRDEA